MSTNRQPAKPPAVVYQAAERAILRDVPLRSLTALEQMYAYFGSNRA